MIKEKKIEKRTKINNCDKIIDKIIFEDVFFSSFHSCHNEDRLIPKAFTLIHLMINQ